MTLSGCGNTAPVRPPLAVQLPPPPDFARPVNVKEPRSGEFLLVIASRERAGRQQANKRIIAFRQWYSNVARELSQKTPQEAPEGNARQQ